MKLNHLNLCVDDLSEAAEFFQTLFQFRLLDRKGEAIAVMTDEEGFTLVLSNPGAFGGEAPAYPQDFHIGFYVDTRDEVDRFHSRLSSLETFRLQPGNAPKPMRGGYTLYFRALGGILFEVTCIESSK